MNATVRRRLHEFVPTDAAGVRAVRQALQNAGTRNLASLPGAFWSEPKVSAIVTAKSACPLGTTSVDELVDGLATPDGLSVRLASLDCASEELPDRRAPYASMYIAGYSQTPNPEYLSLQNQLRAAQQQLAAGRKQAASRAGDRRSGRSRIGTGSRADRGTRRHSDREAEPDCADALSQRDSSISPRE